MTTILPYNILENKISKLIIKNNPKCELYTFQMKSIVNSPLTNATPLLYITIKAGQTQITSTCILW
jgi:hypothetical protein